MNPNSLFAFPPQASAMAGHVDAVFWGLVGLTVFFTGLIFLLVAVFAVVYRRKKNATAPQFDHHSKIGQTIEITWTVVPLIIALGIFAWSAHVFVRMYSPAPAGALSIFVTGKQWMWKFEHPDGRREINELHIPIHKPVRLLMISEDVIHDVGIPAFRTKHDVIPMRYTTEWFTATEPGKYHLYCNQYCGDQHAEMVGWIYAQTPEEYQAWLNGLNGQPQASGSPAELGRALMQNLQCFSCHRTDSEAKAPQLEGLFGHPVNLVGGQTLIADENYIRESILNPAAQIVAGWQNIMPSYQGRLTEDQVNQVVTYIKSLGENK